MSSGEQTRSKIKIYAQLAHLKNNMIAHNSHLPLGNYYLKIKCSMIYSVQSYLTYYKVLAEILRNYSYGKGLGFDKVDLSETFLHIYGNGVAHTKYTIRSRMHNQLQHTQI